jgi:hypothetical protein
MHFIRLLVLFFVSFGFVSAHAALPELSDGLVYAKDASGVFGYKDTPKLLSCTIRIVRHTHQHSNRRLDF